MEYTANLWTLENGKLVKKNMSVDSYFSLSPYIEGDDDGDGDVIECATLAALYRVWQEEKAGDSACGVGGRWKYHFYHHKISVEKNSVSGKPEFVDLETPGKIYRRAGKIYFKPL